MEFDKEEEALSSYSAGDSARDLARILFKVARGDRAAVVSSKDGRDKELVLVSRVYTSALMCL